MQRLHAVCLIWGLVSLLALLPTTHGQNQEQAADADSNKPPLPVIADEPRTIDPLTLIAEPLRKKVNVKFEGTSLREIAEWISTQASLPVLLDQRPLMDEAGVSANEPISDQLQDEPLYLFFNRLARSNIGWYIEDNVVHLSSIEDAQQKLSTRFYNVGDLLDKEISGDSIVGTLTNTVHAASWDDMGGEGNAQMLGDVLFVRQTEAIHVQIAGLLQAIRSPGRQTFVADPLANLEIRDKLKSTTTVNFDDTPLEEAVRILSQQTSVDIRLDRMALREKRIRGREPISLRLADRDLGTILKVMLGEFELSTVLQDGVLWVTSVDEPTLRTAVYDVRDLCQNSDESDALAEAITSQTDPDSWSELGGEGSLDFITAGTLVIENSDEVHNLVLQLLQNYRTALRSSKPRESEDASQELITRYYKVDTAVAEDLGIFIPIEIQPDSWAIAKEDAVGTIRWLASKPQVTKEGDILPSSVLVIYNTRSVHQEVEEVIQRVNNGDGSLNAVNRGGGMSGMGGGMGFGGMFDVSSELSVQQPK
ncbi:MAG: hypothetical protein KDA87_17375 [Planctomycetales bacterium]|nr:hypothetical protein [Planctomycetales bacterium]